MNVYLKYAKLSGEDKKRIMFILRADVAALKLEQDILLTKLNQVHEKKRAGNQAKNPQGKIAIFLLSRFCFSFCF